MKDEKQCMCDYETAVQKRVLKKKKRQQKVKSKIKVVKTRKNLKKKVIQKVEVTEK